MSAAPAAPAAPMSRPAPVRRGRGALARLVRKPPAALCLGYLLAVCAASGLAGAIAPYGPDDQDLTHALTGPSASHLLGAGVLGKDVLSRLLYGGQATLTAVVVALAVYAAIGVPAGILAGYRGGRLDRLTLRIADLVFAVPAVIILFVVLAIFPNDETAAMVALGLLGAPGLARVVRSATLGVREELYVRAAVASGIPDRTILRRHVLPRVTGPIIVQLSVYGAGAVLLETGLGFLGLGTTQASWGNLVAEASQNLGTQPWLLVPSGTVIITFVLALGLLGDQVRETLSERHTPAAPALHRRAAAIPHRPPTAGTDAEPPQEEDALLSVRGLTVTFPVDGQRTDVVRDVSFTVRAGEALGVLGESGCGKTATATSLIGLLPAGGRVTAGSVWFDGIDLLSASPAQLRRIRGGRIGWISQDPVSSLDPSFTAGAQIAEAVRAHTTCSRPQARRRALELLELVGVADPQRVARSHPHQMSGGIAQRVGIAAALACDPALVIADEPTTALDVTVQADILDVLRTLRGSGTAIILITHDWGVLADLCERAVVMYAGQCVEQADVTTLVTAPAHPYTAGLLASDPHRAQPGQPLPALRGTVPAPREWPTGCRFADRCSLVTDACRTAPITMTAVAPGTHLSRCIRTHDLVTGGPQ